jgi:hypothetical protein
MIRKPDRRKPDRTDVFPFATKRILGANLGADGLKTLGTDDVDGVVLVISMKKLRVISNSHKNLAHGSRTKADLEQP